MVTALALSHGVKEAGIVAAALLAAAAVLAPGARLRAGAMLGALVLTPVLLVAEIWDTPQFEPVRDRPILALAGAAMALVVIAALARAFDRRPALFALAVVFVLPFRVPIESGGDTSNLLVPLYAVIAAGALAFIVPRLRGRRDDVDEPRAGVAEWLLVGSVVLYAVQGSYSSDFTRALEQVVFFYVPFVLLFSLLLHVAWTPEVLRRCLWVLAALAALFCAVGFYEYATQTILLNPDVIATNQFQSYFRVNSLFFDPNIFGRFLAVVMVALAAALLWSARGRSALLVALALAVAWGGLVLTLSQSSLLALLAGLAVLAALHWSLRATAGAILVGAAIAVVVVAAFPGAVRLNLEDSKGREAATSGRADLIRGGAELFAERPLQGFGSGSFTTEYRRAERVSGEAAGDASHTIPLTIASEQGVGGLLLYLALLVAAFLRLLRGARSSPRRAAIAAAFTALVVHTQLYAAFLEDPLTWTLLGVGTVLAWGARDSAGDAVGDRDPEPA